VLTEYYRPEPNFTSAAAAEPMGADVEVTVVTHSNYQGGRLYPGVRPLCPKRTAEVGVTVWRPPLIPHHGNPIVRSQEPLNLRSIRCVS
jgi:hypothetical protein